MTATDISVSIIIPMYNAERFIEPCLNSILRQSFTDFEIIIVDDCSTDRSVALVEGFVERFNGRLHLIKRDVNSGGSAQPRNDALKIARGKYVTFVDDDDLLSHDALKKIVDVAERTGADVVHSDRHFSTAAEVIDAQTKLSIVSNPKASAEKIHFEPDDLAVRIRDYRQNAFFGNWVVWNKLFRREFLSKNQITFPDLHVADDMMFSFKCLCFAKKYARITEPLYVYRVRKDSFSRENNSLDDYVRKWASMIIRGVKILDDFMDGVDFFKQHGDCKYLVFDLFVSFHFDHYLSRVYAERKPYDFDHILRDELSKAGDGGEAFTAFLFSLANVHALRVKALQRDNNQLREQVNRLKSETQSNGAKQTLRTWDIFDTLIARRCVLPEKVFSIVEQRGRVKNFATLRQNAERFVQRRGGEYTLDTIYDAIRERTHADAKLVDRLKQLECDVEFEQAIPIVENISQVKSGDVLITDMYLSEAMIRRLLRKCGLAVPVEIIVSNHGKSSGAIWKQLRDRGVHVFHTGDNQVSDVGKPREFQFDSSWSVISRPTPIETQLMKLDFDFGAYLRELRLSNPYQSGLERIYWTAFVLNAGCLMLMAQLIDKVQKHYGFEYLGFCGRDTYYLRALYQRLKDDRHEAAPANSYLYYSRKLIGNSEADLGRYFKAAIGDRRALLVDLTGTGVHMRMLRERHGLKHSFLIFLMFNPDVAAKIYPEFRQYLPIDWRDVREELSASTATPPEFLYVFERKRDGITDIDELERFNRATHNSPIRMKAVEFGGRVIPEVTFSEVDDSDGLAVFEACLKKIMQSKIQWSRLDTVDALTSALKPLLLAFEEMARRLRFTGQHDVQEAVDHLLTSPTKPSSIARANL